MTNRLEHTQSPYLLQHKDNPVDWHPWGEEAFEKAREEDRPIFLSIGYSTCHWCHVMERESFEDSEVARLMNETFVNIKVDREERPDVDQIYMTACQMMTGQGGWPLTILLTPEKKPFFAATYLPKQSRFGRMGMLDLVPRIREVWEDERDRLHASAEELTQRLQQVTEHIPAEKALDADHLDIAYKQLSERFDPQYGGFGDAPKFPSPHTLLFLLRYWRRTEEAHAREMVTTTLDRMRLGGIFDQLGYGFHRYSTDAEWKLPHFEKMLYDQALLTTTYTEAFQATRNASYRQTAQEVIEYVLRDLMAPEGAFYSAEDADTEGREGAYYIWTIDEVREVLGDEQARLFIRTYNLEEKGNFVEEATKERTGESLLYLRKPIEALAENVGIEPGELRKRLQNGREQLFQAREQRERPGLDDKILTDWNGLMIAALARAGQVFGEPSFVEYAEKALFFVHENLRSHHGYLLHRYREGEAGIRGKIDDYAFLIWGLIELYQATFDASYLEEALELTGVTISEFHDEEHGAFYFYSKHGEQLIARPKEAYDGAMPSGNSVMMWNLIRLSRITGKEEYDTLAQDVSSYFAEHVGQQPAGFTGMLVGLDAALSWEHEIVIAGDPTAEDTRAMVEALREEYLPNSVILLRPNDPDDPIADIVPIIWEQRPLDGKATAYVCENYQCEQPTTRVETMLGLIQDKKT